MEDTAGLDKVRETHHDGTYTMRFIYVAWTTLAISILVILISILWGLYPAIPGPDDVPLNKEIATVLVMDLEKYKKITEMDDCKRSQIYINGVAVKMDKRDTTYYLERYYEEVLNEKGIDIQEFEHFRSILEEAKLRHFIRVDEYSVFIVDGFLDSVWGYLYIHDDCEVSYDYFEVDAYTIRIVEDLGDNWYRFGGT